jgi:geranylgeranyl diphosphate synthase, type II
MLRSVKHHTDEETLFGRYKTDIERHLNRYISSYREPRSVYGPIKYIMSSGGKRFRAVLVLLSCEAVGGTPRRAYDAAAAMEILHNFTLVHDDVMDHAVVRRGKMTIHTKWDENVAILSGDEMIAQAYSILLNTRSPRKENILKVYTDALVQVCEGQGFDKEFETRSNVCVKDYFMMIGKKTGRVIEACAEIGALIGNGTPAQVRAMRTYAGSLGCAFQVMDDLLDITGDEKTFGKKIGGDIREGKKTFLLLHALSHATGGDRKLLRTIRPGTAFTRLTIKQIRNIYEHTGAIAAARAEVISSTARAKRALKTLPDSCARRTLFWLSQQLLSRTT